MSEKFLLKQIGNGIVQADEEAPVPNTKPVFDYVKVTVDYTAHHYETYQKLDEKFNNKVEDYYKIVYASGTKTPGKYDNAIKRLNQRSIDQVLRLQEESGWRVKINNVSAERVNTVEFNKYSHNPRQIIMKNVLPIRYKFLKGTDLNIPLKDATCVPSWICKAFKKKIPTLTVEKFKEIVELGRLERANLRAAFGDDPEIREDGYTADDIQIFCDYYKISHYALDMDHNLFLKKIVHPRQH